MIRVRVTRMIGGGFEISCKSSSFYKVEEGIDLTGPSVG